MPIPPVNPTRPSTIRSFRWVRLLNRSRVYHRSGRYITTTTPAPRIRSTSSSSIFLEPIQSTTTWTGTPARARSASASANWVAISPDQKM
jgi:hypothetical protein